MEPPVAAIVVPVRNGERYLPETLASALAQTEPRLEVVVVDDGSTDGTAAVVKECARRDRRVTLLGQANRGVSTARNAGARVSRAPLLCFLDADDLLPPDHVRRGLAILGADPDAGVSYSRALMFRDEDPSVREVYAFPEVGADLVEELLRGGVSFPLHSALVRRRWFDRIGGFDGRYPLNEDTFFWLRLILSGCRFVFMPGSPVLYRRHAAARSTDLVRVVPDRLRLLDWLARRGAALRPDRREAVRGRRRFLALVLAGELAARGKSLAARAEALRSLRWSRRPGHVLEVLRFLAAPRAG